MRPLPRTALATATKGERGDITSTVTRALHEREIRSQRSLHQYLHFAAGRLSDSFVNALWSNPDQVIAAGRMLKDGDRCTVVQISLDGADDRKSTAAVLKRYNAMGSFHTATHAVMRSRARWCWINASRLLKAGLRTTMPLGYLEERWAGVLRGRSYLLTEFIPGRSLADVVDSTKSNLQSLDPIADQFVSIWQRLGQLKIGYGDMKASNFIIDPEGKLWLIDLDGVRLYRSPLWLRRERRKDMQSFMRNWNDRPDVAELFRLKLGLR